MAEMATTSLFSDTLHESLAHLLRAPVPGAALPDLAHWRHAWQPLVDAGHSPLALALRGGLLADRMGWAFAAGYQAALRVLLPQVSAQEMPALGATERGGNRPRDIATQCTPDGDGWRLHGAKSWITLGEGCTTLLIVARLPGDAERPQLRVLRVPSDTPGLSLPASAPLPFVPEVPHTQCLMDDVRLPAAAMLPGDGYSDYVKPFRTIEDTFVNLALLAYALREARARRWPRALVSRLLAAITGLAALSTQPPASPVTHLSLDGLLAEAAALYGEVTGLMNEAVDEAAVRWRRDVPLFGVAGKARAARAERAWEQLVPAE